MSVSFYRCVTYILLVELVRIVLGHLCGLHTPGFTALQFVVCGLDISGVWLSAVVVGV